MSIDSSNCSVHGWHYRRHVIGKLEKETQKSWAKEEFEYTTEKINANFSNYSAWHNRSKLIPEYIKHLNLEEKRQFLASELQYATTAIYTDPDDQSTWIYHHWLVMNPQEVVKSITSEEKKELLINEVRSISELYEVEPDCKNCMFFLATYLFQCKKQCQISSSDLKVTCTELIDKLKEIDPMRKHMYETYGAAMKGY